MNKMGQLVEIPFRSYHRLRQWRNEQSLGTHFQTASTEIWYDAMDSHFQKVLPQIRISCAPEEIGTQCVDVQIEAVIEGHPMDLYLMTLVTSSFAEAQRRLDPEEIDFDFGSSLELLDSPFQQTVLWHSSALSPNDIVNAVRAWSQHFWPDFECEYVFSPAEDWIPEPVSCRVLVKGQHEMLGQLWSWLVKHGCEEVYCSPNDVLLLLDFPIEHLTRLREDFEGLPFEASYTPTPV